MRSLDIKFTQRPGLLLFGLIPLALLAVYVVVQARRRQRLRRFTEAEVPQSWWRHVPIVVALLSLFLLTVALATPTHDMRIPLNRAVVVLVIDVSESMASTDVAPNRLAAAQEAGKKFADELTPAINLGLVEFAANASLLVSPTTNRAAVKAAIDGLKPAPKTATGEGIFTALQAIATVGSVMGGGEGPPPARIVLESDGGENKPLDPSDPQG
ncbi:VWA domain-containing protein, partial [Mycobacterium sp. E2327]|uniref:VWA domain-containing protein n=1 Tax=Mycobacterium sp. E2327 TaxID=1834132 RepID=UPI0012EA1BDC